MSLESIGSIELPKKQEGKPYLAILKEPISLDEKLMAIYTKAISEITIFKPHRLPDAPTGFVEAHQAYKVADKDDKVSMWKGIIEHKDFKGYILEADRVNAENSSNKHFLKEMMDYFEAKQIFTYADKIRAALNEYCAL